MSVLPLPPRLVGLAASLLLLATGCGSPPKPEPPGPQPVISATSRFLDGEVEVVAELGPFRLVDALPPERLGGIPVVIDETDINQGPPRTYAGGHPESGAPGRPRQSLTVAISNIGAESIEMRVAEVRSVLGNFVPVPEIFTLEPGELQALEPMRASYPAPIDQLELVIRLRTTEAEEVKTLVLRL